MKRLIFIIITSIIVIEALAQDDVSGIGNIKTNMINTQIDFLFLDKQNYVYKTYKSIKVTKKAYLSKEVFWVETDVGHNYFYIKNITLQEDQTTYKIEARHKDEEVLMMYINKDNNRQMCIFLPDFCLVYHLIFRMP